jgi:prepilin-type N-terminal cleavage/methylation domain-containing protein
MVVRHDARGFSLIEAVVAVSLLAVGVSATAQLAVVSARANVSAHRAGVALQATREKMEQLRALAWTSDAGLVPISDWSSDLSINPMGSSGGVGLGVSPGETLLSNTAGYCDFLDVDGQWLAGGTSAPVGAAWVRRWRIDPLDALPDTLVLQVIVVPAHVDTEAAAVSAARGVNGTWLVGLRTRRTR